MSLRPWKISLLLLATAATPLLAVIDVRMPLGKMYVQSKAVFTSEITSIDAETKVIEAKPVTAYKSEAPAATLKFQVRDPATLIAGLAAKDAPKTIVHFDGLKTAAIHLGEHGYTALLGPRPGTYIIISRNKELDAAHPGKTVDLVREVEKLQKQDKESATAPAK